MLPMMPGAGMPPMGGPTMNPMAGALGGGMPPLGGLPMMGGGMPPIGAPGPGGGAPNLMQMLDGPAGLQVLQVLLQTLQQNQTPPGPESGGSPLVKALLGANASMGGGMPY